MVSQTDVLYWADCQGFKHWYAITKEFHEAERTFYNQTQKCTYCLQQEKPLFLTLQFEMKFMTALMSLDLNCTHILENDFHKNSLFLAFYFGWSLNKQSWEAKYSRKWNVAGNEITLLEPLDISGSLLHTSCLVHLHRVQMVPVIKVIIKIKLTLKSAGKVVAQFNKILS